MHRANGDMSGRHAKRDEGRIQRVSMACSRRNPRFENVGKIIMTMNDRARHSACQPKLHRYCLQITSWFVIRVYRRPSPMIHRFRHSSTHSPINAHRRTQAQGCGSHLGGSVHRAFLVIVRYGCLSRLTHNHAIANLQVWIRIFSCWASSFGWTVLFFLLFSAQETPLQWHV